MFNEVQALKLRNRFWSDICIAERKQGILNTIEFVPGQEGEAPILNFDGQVKLVQ